MFLSRSGLLVLLCAVLLSGCETAAFYSQAAVGHWQILSSREPIEALIEQETLDDVTTEKLTLILQLRDFAEQQLLLPVGDNYRDYTDTQRPYVVWNVFAAPELSIEPLRWCFPVAGCVSYKGYFDEKKARDQAAQLASEGYDVYVGGVAAYSTLGWFDDVVLNTFIKREDSRLAALLFHELAHQQLYLKGDTTFNESFARAVEIEGVQRWLKIQQRTEEFSVYLSQQKRHTAWVSLLAKYQKRLAVLYQSSQSEDKKRQQKKRLIEALLNEYQSYKKQWNYTGYDHWMNDSLNNAKLATVADYNDWVPAFRQLLREEEGDWQVFYQRCKQLSKLEKAPREERMQALAEQFQHSFITSSGESVNLGMELQ